jgi:hypothetical protein
MIYPLAACQDTTPITTLFTPSDRAGLFLRKEKMMSKLSKPNTALEEPHPFQEMNRANQNAAGVDIGAREIMVYVPGPDHTQLVRSFGNYTADLYAIAKWLGEHNIYAVAMESAGVYTAFSKSENLNANF